MAESESNGIVETEGEERESEGEEDDEEEADEFRLLFAEAEGESKRLKSLAMKAEQAGDASAAAVLREVAGGVVQLILDLIATTGGTVQDLQADEEGSRLDDDDAEKLHGLLLACRKLASEVMAAGATGESKQGLEALLKLSDDQLEFVLEISECEPVAEQPGAN